MFPTCVITLSPTTISFIFLYPSVVNTNSFSVKHGCDPTETIVPFTKSTSSNISGYCFLASSSSVSTKLLNSFAKDTYS